MGLSWGSQIVNLTGAVIVTYDLPPDLKLLAQAYVASHTAANAALVTEVRASLARLEAGQLALAAGFTQEKNEMSVLTDKIQNLQDNITAETTVVGGVKLFCESIPKLIADAVAAALAKGATPAELQSLTDLGTAIQKNSADLAAAIVAGTPTPVPVPVP